MKKMKKALSLLLALVMVLGMVNLSAFAAGDETSGTIVEQKTEWTMTGDGSVGHKKTVEKTGENTFKITLSVKTKEEIQKEVISPDAAVVVVMDVSNSMKDDVDGKKTGETQNQRITKAKAAAEKFITDFAADAEGAQRKVALVEFGSNAKTVQGWSDAENAKNTVSSIGINFEVFECTTEGKHTHDEDYLVREGKKDSKKWVCKFEDCTFTSSKDANHRPNHTHKVTYDGPHGTTKDGGGTNIEGGLQLAYNLLGTTDIQRKYVVLITDGVPTYHVYQDHYAPGDTNFIEGQQGGGNRATEADYKNVPAVATNIKSKGPLYTVSYASSKVTSTVNNQSIDAWLSSFATKNVPAGSDIDWGLSKISETIKNQAKAWILTDPIPAPYIVYRSEDNQSIPDGAVNPGNVLTYKPASDGTTLTWNLKDETAAKTELDEDDVTWYIYSTSYTIHLDTTATDFVEDQPYVTNSPTTLTYMLTKDGELQSDLKSTDLVVPKVSGKLPTASWKIEYYKQENATTGDYANYTLVDTTNSTTDAKLGAEVKLAEQDGGYATKYGSDNYIYAKTENETLTIGLDAGKNVIKVYYDRKTTSAVVNYHYALTIIDEQGHEITTSFDLPGMAQAGLFVGDAYSVDAPETSTYSGYTYDLDHANPDGAKITGLDAEGDKNVIDLYYKKTIDYRKGASVVVNHVYTLHTYELENGKYVAKDVVTNLNNVEKETDLMSGDTYTANTTPRFGYNSYQYTGIVGRDNVKVLGEGENVITLNFEAWEDPRGPELSLTVRHHYTKTVTEIVDGKVETTVNPDNVVGKTDTIPFYAGEAVTIREEKVYGSDTYNSDEGNTEKAGSKITTAADGGTTIDLHYTLTEVPEKTSVTVTHIYQTVTRETVATYEEQPVVDEDGNPVMEDVLDKDGNPVIDHYDTVEKVDDSGNPVVDEDGNPIMEEAPVYAQQQKTEKVETGAEVKETSEITDTKNVYYGEGEGEVLYVNQRYQAELQGKEGYKFLRSTPDNYTIDACAANGNNQITIIYQKIDEEDNRGAATIDVQHIYTTHVTAIVGGEEKTFDIVTSEFDQATTGQAGDEFLARTKLTDKDGNTYTLAGSAPGGVILHEGLNNTIVINYERADNQLGSKAGYTVTYEYYTRTMTMMDGVAVWGDPVLDTETTKTPTGGDGYVGQMVKLDTGAKDGYAACGGNPSATQFLSAGENSWTFKYVKDVPLEKVSVTVNHHVTTITKTIDNPDGASFTQDLMGRPEYKYVGEFYEAKALELGENAKLTLVNVNGNDSEVKTVISFDGMTGTTVVDFYYEVVNDYRVPASYTVQHIYKSIDWDGKVMIDNPDSQPIETKGYAGQTGAATVSVPEGSDYELIEVTYNGSDVKDRLNEEGVYSFTVLEGANTVVLVYERKADTRPLTAVKVVHEYYTSASAETPAYTDEEITKDLRVSAEFKAAAKPTKDNVTYAQITEDGKLTINALGEVEWNEAKTEVTNYGGNVITIKYVLADTTYKVVHEYYIDGNLAGKTDPTSVPGTAGATVNASDITKADTYNGTRFTFDAAKSDASLTLVQGENGTITLRYYFTTPTPTPTPDPTPSNPTYKVTYEWSGLPAGADAKVPGDRNYSYNSSVKVNTTYTGTSEITIDGVVYTFSGWTTKDVTVNDGGFRMPSKTVTLVGVWTAEGTDIPDENPPLVDLPDENPPLADMPDEQPPLTDVPDEQPPLVEVPEEQPPMIDWPPLVAASDPAPVTDIPEEDVPLANVPQTGDFSAVWYVAVIASVAGLAVLTFKKREDEET